MLAYISGMGTKRVLWEVRVLKASAVLIGTVYAPVETSAELNALLARINEQDDIKGDPYGAVIISAHPMSFRSQLSRPPQ